MQKQNDHKSNPIWYYTLNVCFFSNSPISVFFQVWFDTSYAPDLRERISSILYTIADKETTNGYEILNVGRLQLIWRNYTIDVYPTNTTTTSTQPPTRTTSQTDVHDTTITRLVYIRKFEILILSFNMVRLDGVSFYLCSYNYHSISR